MSKEPMKEKMQGGLSLFYLTCKDERAHCEDCPTEECRDIVEAICRLIKKSEVTTNKNKLSGWLFGFMKELAISLRENRRFYPTDDDVDKLKQIHHLIESQPEVDDEWIDEIAQSMRCADDSGWTRGEVIRFILREVGARIKEKKCKIVDIAFRI